ncbi:MAG: glycoside hydrolase family 71/99-like protein [Verrucomicrobiales bacterium]|nr:glycoside hydrolase family 71/99-like protein [Verrucomicrobiales bacterium]
MKRFSIFLPVLIVLLVSAQAETPVSRDAAYAVLSPAEVIEGERKANPEGIDGRVVTGYQGWFRAEGDGSGMGFHHYEKRQRFEPGHCTIDLWPDLSEFDEDEKFPTPFRHADGSVAHVFSSIHPKTVDRHFQWMADYGIDGAFVQRFATHGARERRNWQSLKWENEKLKLCRDAAMKHNRSWVLMYDLSGLKDDDFTRLAEDWKNLRRKMQLGTDPNDSAYLHLDGKPLVAIWGVGFGDDREYSLEKAEWFIRLLKHNPEWGGMSIMLGVPYFWREQSRDATDHERLHEVLKLADIISPWSVGRYRGKPGEMAEVTAQQAADRDWCEPKGIKTLPVLFPGFSWKNLYGEDEEGIPREKGKFLWKQFQATAASGNNSAYVAMFDEIDEGTAIFKCTNDPPTGASQFGSYEGLPSDHYLWLTGEGGRLLRGEVPSR